MVFNLIDFQATLQPNKNFVRPSNLFIPISSEKNFKYVKKAAFEQYWDHFRTKNLKRYNFFSKGIFIGNPLFRPCGPLCQVRGEILRVK